MLHLRCFLSCAVTLGPENSPDSFGDRRCGEWWTGEDSNLRSPQGAADLQSAGFSHSPTRPHGKLPSRSNVVSIRGETPARLCYSRRKQSVLFVIGDPPPQHRYDSKISWRRDLNPRPSDYKSDALPLSYASAAQTKERYQKGTSIARGFAFITSREQFTCPNESFWRTHCTTREVG